jgi:probable rRNA maturation factor
MQGDQTVEKLLTQKATINIANLQRKQKVNQKLVRCTLKRVIENLFYGHFEIDIYFCSPLYIRKLNKKFRGIDKTTDVLSFEFKEYAGQIFFIGELVICPSEAKKNSLTYNDFWKDEGWAKEENRSNLSIENGKNGNDDFEKEIILLLVHGILHLFGYDHSEEMKRMQWFLYKEAVSEK